jgi:hypothetical protein
MQNLDVTDAYFERKALPNRAKSNDDFAFVAELRDDALSSREYAIAHPHPCSYADARMGPKK